MLTTDRLGECQREVWRNGPWIPALPLPGPLRSRLRDAWEVLCGRATAVREPTPAECRRRWDRMPSEGR